MPDSFMLLHMNSCHPSAPAVAVAHLCPRCSLRCAVSFLLLSFTGLLSLHCLGASSAMLTRTGTDLEVWGSQHSPEWTLTKGGKSQWVKLPSPVPFTCILRTSPGGRPHMLTVVACSLVHPCISFAFLVSSSLGPPLRIPKFTPQNKLPAHRPLSQTLLFGKNPM